jgi:hypothetical protein
MQVFVALFQRFSQLYLTSSVLSRRAAVRVTAKAHSKSF